MLVIGLTGGISTGKSTVSHHFKNHGIPVIDADILARKAVERGSPGLAKVVAAFGGGEGEDNNVILLPDGSMDRKKVGEMAFGQTDESKNLRKVLNGIVHPYVRRAMFWSVLGCWVRGEKVCVLDVPLLLEGGLDRFVGMVVVVYCPPETQLKRLMERDGSTEESALGRINSQMPITEKKLYADCVIDNSGSEIQLEHNVSAIIQQAQQSVRFTWWLCWLCPPVGIISAGVSLVFRNIRRFTVRMKSKEL